MRNCYDSLLSAAAATANAAYGMVIEIHVDVAFRNFILLLKQDVETKRYLTVIFFGYIANFFVVLAFKDCQFFATQGIFEENIYMCLRCLVANLD